MWRDRYWPLDFKGLIVRCLANKATEPNAFTCWPCYGFTVLQTHLISWYFSRASQTRGAISLNVLILYLFHVSYQLAVSTVYHYIFRLMLSSLDDPHLFRYASKLILELSFFSDISKHVAILKLWPKSINQSYIFCVFGPNYTKHLLRFFSSHYSLFRTNYKNPCSLFL